MVKKSADMIAVRAPQQRGALIRGESLHGGRARGRLGGEVSKVRWDSLREELEECGGSWGDVGVLGVGETSPTRPLLSVCTITITTALLFPHQWVKGWSLVDLDLKGILSCLVLSWLVSVGMTAGPCSVPYWAGQVWRTSHTFSHTLTPSSSSSSASLFRSHFSSFCFNFVLLCIFEFIEKWTKM